MFDVKFVIGANYGDEGKGLVSAHLAANAQQRGEKCLTVLYNGGAQRGHTVEYDGFRHVFHHFAAGAAFGSDTFFHEDFLINPMTFVQEYNGIGTDCYISTGCRVVTPFDMMANQIIEQGRDMRHGSCGMGIFETIKRYQDSIQTKYKYGFLRVASDAELYGYLSEVQTYYESKGIRFDNIPGLDIRGLKEHWIEDFNTMWDITRPMHDRDIVDFFNKYDTVIFEGGQGLALDMDNLADFPHLTPSKTGSHLMIPWIRKFFGNKVPLEMYYVTRSYLTRHGNGPLPEGYIDMDDIEQDMTNQPNPWQGTLKVTGFTEESLQAMRHRIVCDSLGYENMMMGDIRTYLVVTHVNEVDSPYIPFTDCFDKVYYSESKDCTVPFEIN